MKILGNIIWLIFGGLHTAIEYFIAGLILMITIIGIPWGKMHFRLAKLALSPFGSLVMGTGTWVWVAAVWGAITLPST